MSPMASNQDNFFKVHGAKELAKELNKLSRGTQNQILRPALTKGAAEIRKVAKMMVKSEFQRHTGTLFKSIKSKTFTAKGRNKGLVARIGVLHGKDGDSGYYPKASNGKSEPRPVAVVARTLEKERHFLDRALVQGQAAAVREMLAKFQEKLSAFHAKEGDKGKIK
jgi:hypothetical protein